MYFIVPFVIFLMFLAYLRGIETILNFFFNSILKWFLAYLRGIETGRQKIMWIEFKPSF
ncbi:hypothetical protein TTE2655 [Caldanaerobacter subterraneus subsp. tengcongensis MB4]|uniref:Uncharacterized protein n=1 Tax=Caldanaerobacter subterraneus subsp. tengcongensis (strain DSM 15242 / JCM 11007 / NBRC 100824 / MB4) TaxID=273068 RepID=Q8R6X8_CALS4|nr:hypothetical protein TTE2655 [Caldanaerobacter subterraneus subsp. tengcongensis MB4]